MERVPAEVQIERASERVGTLPPEQLHELVAAEASGARPLARCALQSANPGARVRPRRRVALC